MSTDKTTRIALAGGASPGVGGTIAGALVDHGFHVVILTRHPPLPPSTQSGPDIKSPQLQTVDYDDVQDLLRVLDDHQIDTVISTLPSGLPERIPLNLLEAAKRSKSVRRYVPSYWGAGIDVNVQIARFRGKNEELRALRDSGLEYTCILPGQYFMNYLAQGSDKNLRGEAMSALSGFPIAVDVRNRRAEIPGEGDQPLVFTRLEDLGRGVVEVMERETWTETSWVVGDVVSWNQVVSHAERITGTIFDVTRIPLTELSHRASKSTGRKQMLLQLQVCDARGELVPRPTDRAHRPAGAYDVERFLQEWWGCEGDVRR